MKKTIREDNQRKVIKQEYLNENSLQEVALVDGKIQITIRFVEGMSIKEHILATMTPEELINEVNTYKVSDDGKKIALFRKKGDEYCLERLYDLEKHEFSISDFIDIEYKKHFKTPALNKYLRYKTGDSND